MAATDGWWLRISKTSSLTLSDLLIAPSLKKKLMDTLSPGDCGGWAVSTSIFAHWSDRWRRLQLDNDLLFQTGCLELSFFAFAPLWLMFTCCFLFCLINLMMMMMMMVEMTCWRWPSGEVSDRSDIVASTRVWRGQATRDRCIYLALWFCDLCLCL